LQLQIETDCQIEPISESLKLQYLNTESWNSSSFVGFTPFALLTRPTILLWAKIFYYFSNVLK